MIDPRSVTAFAPGSIGNLGSGFDVLGMALSDPGDRVTAKLSPGRGVSVTAVTGPFSELPPAGSGNSAAVAVGALLELAGAGERGLDLEVEKGLPLSAGMGGSAASAVAAVLAVDALLDLDSPSHLLLDAALRGEASAAGAAHPDNAAASLLGGIVLVRGGPDRRDVIRLPTPAALWYALAHPHLELATATGRSVLPESIPLGLAVRQWGNVAGLVAALHSGDLERLGLCTEDLVAEPARASLIPGFDAVRRAALGAGALGFGISGSGPSVFAFTGSRESAGSVAQAMVRAFRDGAGIDADGHVGAGGAPGARIVDTARSSGARREESS